MVFNCFKLELMQIILNVIIYIFLNEYTISEYKSILMHEHQADALLYRCLRNVPIVDLHGIALVASPLLAPAWGREFLFPSQHVGGELARRFCWSVLPKIVELLQLVSHGLVSSRRAFGKVLHNVLHNRHVSPVLQLPLHRKKRAHVAEALVVFASLPFLCRRCLGGSNKRGGRCTQVGLTAVKVRACPLLHHSIQIISTLHHDAVQME